jgi:hypothetical protein
MDDKAKLSRRSMLRGVILLAGGSLAAGVIRVQPAYAQKMTKEATKYQDTPKDGLKCKDCVYFQSPAACGLVEGKISPDGWCSLYNKKP